MSDNIHAEKLEKRLLVSLLLCRLGIVFIFGMWAYGTIIRPEIASHHMLSLIHI